MAEREVVAITGASAGIGRAIAQEFARHGAAVGLIARGQAGLDAAAREVTELRGTAYAHQADVAEYEQVEAAAAAIEERLGPIDIWVNNAMTTVFAFFDDIEPAEYERATRVTYLGTVWGTKAALKRMTARTGKAHPFDEIDPRKAALVVIDDLGHGAMLPSHAGRASADSESSPRSAACAHRHSCSRSIERQLSR